MERFVIIGAGVAGIRAAQTLRKFRPEDLITVISIDDIEEAARFAPMLTTIQIPKGDMAHFAVLSLIDRLQGGHRACVRMELPCHLMVRESAGMYLH